MSIQKLTSKYKLNYLLSIFLSYLSLTTCSYAFQLSPAVAALDATGIKSEQIYLLTNSSPKPAAIQFSVTTRQQNTDGSEQRNPAASSFSVHPSQVVIPGGGTQKVKVKWVGGRVNREQAYRFIAKQLPIQLEQKGDISLNIVMTMEGALYVKPANAANALTTPVARSADYTPSAAELAAVEQAANQTSTRPEALVVKQVQVVNTAQGKRLSVTVHNPTHEHIILHQLGLQLSNPVGQSFKLSGQQLGNLLQQNLLGGATRHFMLPTPQGFDASKTWQGRFSSQP